MIHALATADRLTLPNHLRRLHLGVSGITRITPPQTPDQLAEQPFPFSDAEQTDRKLEGRKDCCAEGLRDSRPGVIPAACVCEEGVCKEDGPPGGLPRHCRGCVCLRPGQVKPDQTRPGRAQQGTDLALSRSSFTLTHHVG